MLVAVGLLTLAAALGTAFSPYLLLHSPLLLIALTPDAHLVALASRSVGIVPLVGLTVFRRLIAHAIAYWLGVEYGRSALSWVQGRSQRVGRWVVRLERLFERWGAPLLLVAPIYPLSVLAGVVRTRRWVFLGSMTLSQTFWVTSTYLFGEAISEWTAPALTFLEAHLLEATLVCVALVGLQQLVSWRRRRRALRIAALGADRDPARPAHR